MAKYNRRVRLDKQNLIPIDNWEDTDKLIGEIGDLTQKINKAQESARDDINEIKSALADEIKPHQETIKRYICSLEAFSVVHKAEFGRKRSRKLNFGTLGWRKSTSIIIKKNTLELIKELLTRVRQKACIRVKETVDKDALAKLTDEQLADIKARREEKDVFFVEPDLPEAVDYCD